MKINLGLLISSVIAVSIFSAFKTSQGIENSLMREEQTLSVCFGPSRASVTTNTISGRNRGGDLERNNPFETQGRKTHSNYVAQSSVSTQGEFYQQANYSRDIIDLTQNTPEISNSTLHLIKDAKNKRGVRDTADVNDHIQRKKPRHEDKQVILPDDIFFHIFRFPGSVTLGSTSMNLHRLFCSAILMRTMYINSEEKFHEVLKTRNLSGNYELPFPPSITVCKRYGKLYEEEQKLGIIECQFKLKGISKLLTIHSNLRTLNLDNIKMNIKECASLATALKINTNLKSLNLHNNSIGFEEGKILIEAFKVNSTLTSLNFHKDGIEFDGGLSFSDDGTVTYRDHPDRNEINEGGGLAISDILKTNTSLKSLNLWGNNIGSKGATLIGQVMEANTSLELLDLSNNKILDEGAVAIGRALTTNSYLTSLNLKWNEIGDKGATAIGSALSTNISIKMLDIGKNMFSPVGAQKIINALAINTSLTTLGLEQVKGASHPIGQEGGKKIIEILKTNTSLTSLKLWGHRIANYYQTKITKSLENNLKNNTELDSIVVSKPRKSNINKGPKRKLTWEQTQMIKAKFKAGDKKTAIAKEFGININTVNRYLDYDDEAPFSKGKKKEIPRSIELVRKNKESKDEYSVEEDVLQRPIKKPRFMDQSDAL